MKNTCFAEAAKATVPLFFGYVSIGIPFGLMVVNAGYPVWLAPVMGLTMYTGAGQYIAIGLFAAGASLGTVIAAELLVGIRHIVYGLSLITKFKNVGKWKAYLIFALTDETYSLLASREPPEGCDAGKFYGMISALNQSYWVLGSAIGAVAGTLIPFSFAGVDFALTALFIVLLVEQLRSSRDIVPAAIGAFVTLVVVVLSHYGFIPDANILLISLPLSLAALILLRGRKFNKSDEGKSNERGAKSEEAER